MKVRHFERDISWLSFNYRVLQEAANEDVPLLERIKFLAIFSSNLEEFYRVRVANYYKLVQSERKSKIASVAGSRDAEDLIEKINRITDKHQQEFGSIFYGAIIPALKKENIHFVQSTTSLNAKQLRVLTNLYNQEIKPHLDLQLLDNSKSPFLLNTKVYFLIRAYANSGIKYYLCKLPVEEYGRFIELKHNKKRFIIQIDDVVRYFITQEIEALINCYAIKVTRDAELYLEEEFEGSMVERIRKSLPKRETGSFTRMLYDEDMPVDTLKFLKSHFNLRKRNLVRGGRYHNFDDFFAFPEIDKPKLYYEEQPALSHPLLENCESYKRLLKDQNVLLHFPYHKYDYTIEFLNQAINDSATKHIYITLYRVSSTSSICKLLIDGCKKGIKVSVFDEVKARFDEASNIYWGEELEKAGAKVIYSFEDLKVHTKLLCIDQSTKDQKRYLSYLSTGNFNAKTAKVYSDFALLTSDENYGSDIIELFRYFSKEIEVPVFNELCIAPFSLRNKICELIDSEIALAKSGKTAMLTFKLNSLEDIDMIQKLYEASAAGVKIRLIIRGICCLVPGVKGLSENIKVRSIVDRYLEHARVYISHGTEQILLSSADLMKRNLSRRIEVAFQLKDDELNNLVKEIIEIQWSDNVKARNINISQSNPFHKSSGPSVRSQYATYEMLKNLQLKAPSAIPVSKGEF